jgi:hypothetical protein
MKKKRPDKFKTTKPAELYWDDPQYKKEDHYESPMANIGNKEFKIARKSKKGHKEQ